MLFELVSPKRVCNPFPIFISNCGTSCARPSRDPSQACVSEEGAAPRRLRQPKLALVIAVALWKSVCPVGHPRLRRRCFGEGASNRKHGDRNGDAMSTSRSGISTARWVFGVQSGSSVYCRSGLLMSNAITKSITVGFGLYLPIPSRGLPSYHLPLRKLPFEPRGASAPHP